jgi:BirA family transcriptional regulator, biotin operon repressor / biotin---[acetyl-CoA-carboxylase] ligase
MEPRDELIIELKNATDWKSGEQLSRQMSMTRSAVWKHIVKLKEEGYNIESSPKKGYRLANDDVIIPFELRRTLRSDLFIPSESRFLRQCASTNVEARRLAEDGAPEGTMVIAEAQESGKGRRGRQWFSPAGLGLYFSFILRPKMAPAEAARINLLMSVSAAEVISDKSALPVKIKWPNDILINGKKAAGILAEISTELDSISYMIIGLGVNVNIPKAGTAGCFPEELQKTATSLLIETGRKFPRASLLQCILMDFERRYNASLQDGFQAALRRWRELSGIMGKKIKIETAGGQITGTVEDLDSDGALVLRGPKGTLRRFLSGDIIQEMH